MSFSARTAAWARGTLTHLEAAPTDAKSQLVCRALGKVAQSQNESQYNSLEWYYTIMPGKHRDTLLAIVCRRHVQHRRQHHAKPTSSKVS